MSEYVFGANILENLTIGMYQDSKVIYREYIQNACDQIDEAVREYILQPNEGRISIWFDRDNRTINVEDNATGIRASEFENTLGNIADSDKKIGEDKGFRGIGRLCGLAYCRQLVFTSTYKGEDVISVLTCDAEKMRRMIEENEHGEKHTASEVLNAINEFKDYPTSDIDGHWFKVELVGINNENTDLLDFDSIKSYLSFVAPVPYQNTFFYRRDIARHADELGVGIDEYNITLDGETVFKKYGTRFKTSKGADEVFDIAFKDIYDDDGSLLAWVWVGVSRFKAVISKDIQMRGLRLRKENIQIGDDDALQRLFKEDRGHHYFIGEVFALDKDLIPNSQRDYFNENPTRVVFERELRRYFNDELTRIYYDGSAANSAYKKIDAYKEKEADFRNKEDVGAFVDTQHKEKERAGIEKARADAEKAMKSIGKMKKKAEDAPDSVMGRIIQRIESERGSTPPIEIPAPIPAAYPPQREKNPWRTDKLSSLNKKERKLVAKILGIIVATADKETAEKIIRKIEEELQ